jgi:hypothetical protein
MDALKRFQLENDIKTIEASDKLFFHDKEAQRQIIQKAPWKTE